MNNISLEQLPPLSLYIHIPWCIRKCPYCDFNSHNQKGLLPEQEYIQALIKDIEHAIPMIWGRTIETIFIGGGTPSLFSGDAIDELLTQLRMRLRISPYAEITIEANPGTVEQQYIAEYRAAGINRVSLGVQSFNDEHLKSLGRIHNSYETDAAIKNIAKHFDNFNLDIIYGLPKQSIEEAINDIQKAIAYNPTHISAYNLTIEPNTAFAVKTPANIPSDDVCYEMQDEIIKILAKNNFHRYETSAYAKQDFSSKHNTNYWKFGDYLGIGAGAHSKLSFHDKIIRQMRYKQPSEYIARTKTAMHIQTNTTIAIHDVPFEFMMNSLRLVDGFNSNLFTQTTGIPFTQILPKLMEAQNLGYIDINVNHIKPTAKGRDFLNNLLELFLK